MGVLGFVPFLQRTYPQTIRILPNRLKELSGRTLVFDGTLITQRLHFSLTPHPYRHVLGWYRMIKELKECNVEAICVFDGNQRSSAKWRETERRRQLRKIDAARGSIESDRLCRLENLADILHICQDLESHEKERVTQSFLELVANASDLPLPGSPWGEMYGPDIEEVLPHSSGLLQHVAALHGQSFEDIPSVDDTAHLNCLLDPCEFKQDDHQLVRHTETDYPEAASVIPPNPDEISTVLASLYASYRNSTPQLTSLPISATVELEDDPTMVMSKFQSQLALDEGRIWGSIKQSRKEGADQETIESPLQTLKDRSAYMSQSYDRRNNPPTPETYTESKSILHAMGVACVEPTGPYEAEAMASSIVLQGYADYVVSEDSDVLVYEAPLLRNITSRRDPLIIISGAEVRTALSLDRANYLDFTLLLGTDFTQRIKNVGPHRALKFIRKHGSIERIVERETRFPPRVPPQDYLDQIGAARLVFQTLPPVPNSSALEQKEANESLVSELLQKYRLHKLVANDSDYMSSIIGSNYFGDNP